MPPVCESLETFGELQAFVTQQASTGNLFLSEKSLYTAFAASYAQEENPNLGKHFELCLKLLENLGVIYRFSFGKQILLKPKYVGTYASALIATAAEDKQGMGRIPSIEAYHGRGPQFQMADQDRIARDLERPLLSALIEELEDKQLIFPVATNGISYLVFPTQPTRELEDAPTAEAVAASVSFEGDGNELYSSLVVRSLRMPFSKKQPDLYRNIAVFHAKKGGSYGILFHPKTDSRRAEVSVFFDPSIDDSTREDFLDFVRDHVTEKAIPETVAWETKEAVSRESESDCKGQNQLESVRVFVSYEPRRFGDLRNLGQICEDLKRRGITSWLDEWEVRPGDDPIQKRRQAVASHNIALIAVSSSKLSANVQKDCNTFKARNYRIIPIILPGTSSKLELPFTLRDYRAVDFRILGQQPYDRLFEGIAAAARELREPPKPTISAGRHVFLSYCRDDLRMAKKLHDELVQAGHEVWWDQKLVPGEDWKLAVHNAIQRAYAFVICFSENTENRNQSWIFPELLEAIEVFRTLPPDNSVYLIPVRLSDCAIPQISLGEFRWFNTIERLDFFSRNRAKALTRLIEALQKARMRYS